MPSAQGGGAWQQARASARAHRALLSLADTARADDVLQAALTAARLRLGKRRPTDPLLSGAHAVLDTEAEAVWIRSDAAPEDARLYIAHELGHFHLHGGDNSCQCDEHDFDDEIGVQAVGYGPRQRRETEANVWAREFLLPVPLAHSLFHTENLTAPQISAHIGLPLAAVWAQLSEALGLPPSHHPQAGTRPGSPPLPPLMGGEVTEAGEGGLPSNSPPFPLDPSQDAAARAERGPLLVGAGPGTGKTRTLTARVLYLTGQRGVRPENILCLTFSRKAAEEMRERIAAQAPEVARRAAISTFHAYGLDLLRRYGKAAGLPPNPVLLDPVDACALLERRAASLGLSVLRYLHDPAFPIPDILRTISRAKEEMVTPDEFARRAEEADDDKLRDVARVYAVYEDLLREKGALDFSDLMCRALRLLTENDDVRRAEQAQWRHILVDEYQDVNRAGSRMVQAIAGDNAAGLWCVGDLRQAIYRFRGASPANVSRFQADFPGGRRLDLGVNYRSRPALVSLFGSVSGEGVATWQASRQETEQKATISLTVAPTDIAQADFIAGTMQQFAQAEYDYSDMVVLCRTRNQARAMRGQLLDRGIPVAPGPDENGLLGRKDVRDLLTLLSRVADPRGPAQHRFPDLPPGLAPYVVRAGDALDLWTDVLWGAPRWGQRLTDGNAVQRLLALARAFRERSKTVLEDTDDPRRAFLLHIRRMVRMGASFGEAEASEGEAASAPAAVRVVTAHAAKGLEFPVVFVPNLSAGKFPARPGPSLLPSLSYEEDTAAEKAPEHKDSETDEEARLFFVALTRARDHLFLTRAEKYNNRSAAPSPLLKLVPDLALTPFPSPLLSLRDGRGVSNVASPDSSAMEPTSPSGTPLPSRSDSKGEGKGVRVEAWEAELYLRCPRRYYYERVLTLPSGERTAYSAFKRAVEAAMDEENPAAALDASWTAHGPEASHPHAALYRQAAEETVARMPALPAPRPHHAKPSPDASVEPPAFNLALENGVVTVRPDTADSTGTRLQNQTFRKPPAAGEAEAGAEMRLSLLYEAASAQGQSEGKQISVSLHYLQTGETLPVANKPRQREKHLAAYDRALNGIRLRVFTPTPADTADCAICPYFFICPD